MPTLTQRISDDVNRVDSIYGPSPTVSQALVDDQLQYVLSLDSTDYTKVGNVALLCLDVQNRSIGLGPIPRGQLVTPFRNSTSAPTIAR